MNISTLIAELTKAEKVAGSDALITFGPERMPVEGGIIGQLNGMPEVNLAPCKLNEHTGGF